MGLFLTSETLFYDRLIASSPFIVSGTTLRFRNLSF